MGEIHLLQDELIDKIAAGEVVERPFSVVKELVENSIDAGASNIKVELEDGGRKNIVVSDDGKGLDPEDALLAIKRHATSKLKDVEDLFNISTMGFRGEALASIASVSQFSIQTRKKDSSAGVKVTVQNGETLSTSWSGSFGTTVAVSDLFYNIPVRKGFLKRGATEYSYCRELIEALALCMPEIGFTLIHNGKEQLRVSPLSKNIHETWKGEENLRSRSEALLGKDLGKSMVYFTKSTKFGCLEGLVSAPGVEKNNSKHIFAFVNGRWVKDKVLRYGALRGYHSHLLKGKYPVTVLHFTMDPTLVDVNVHPTKTEVRFQYANEVQELVATGIREAIRKGEWAGDSRDTSFQDETREVYTPTKSTFNSISSVSGKKTERKDGLDNRDSWGTTSSKPDVKSYSMADTMKKESKPPKDFDLLFSKSPSPAKSYSAPSSNRSTKITRRVDSFDGFDSPSTPSEPSGEQEIFDGSVASIKEVEDMHSSRSDIIPWDELDFIGSFRQCYLLFAWNEKLLMVDQHAFHERIIYEKLCRDQSILAQRQKLLVPEVVDLSEAQVVRLCEKQETLADCGFGFKKVDDTLIEVLEIPSILAGKDLDLLFSQLSSSEDEEESLNPTSVAGLAHDILSRIACHSALRSGEEVEKDALKIILKEAKEVDFYHNCPHGRPVFKWWDKREIEGWFER